MEGDVAWAEISWPTNCEFINALIQIEDKNYYSHFGVNIPAKLRAIWDNLHGKKISGGSTITEQYVKNKYFKNTKRGYLQKAREAVLALWIDMTQSKTHILYMYLQDVYFGNQLYGLGAAMEVYFWKNKLQDLNEEEIVLLISLLHNPGIQSLDETYFQKYFKQVKTRLGYEFERSYFWKLPKKENIDLFPHVTQKWIQNTAASNISFVEGNVAWATKGTVMEWAIKLSIDATLQSYTETILRQTLGELKEKNVTNGAIFAIDPKSWEILLYVGSKDFYATDIDGEFDVVQAKRQPWSTMKPFLYLLALQSGANPDSLLGDMQAEYDSFQEGKVYISENYSLKEYGLVRLKKALGNSFNNASVRLARELGLEKVYNFYKEYGFDFFYDAEHYGYALVLWNAEVTLEQLVTSYAKLLPNRSPSVEENVTKMQSWEENIVKQSKFLLYDILSDPDNRDISFGVNSILGTSIPQAVKTGTSSDFRDNLTLSYHPDFVLGVWVGNNDNSSMQAVTGISGAGYIWHQIIEKAISLGYIHNTSLQVPKNISQISYCLDRACFRKENVYVKTWVQYFSAISENYYSQRDIYENFSQEEKEKLEALGFEIQK